MILRLPIKSLVFSLLVVLTVLNVNSQSINQIGEDSLVDSKQRYIAYSLGYHNPIASGDNFIGKGLRGNGGFRFKIQIYAYKQLFIGGSIGATYFNVKDRAVVGDYNKTRISESYLYLGYEFVVAPEFRIGITSSVLGSSRYKNKKSSGIYQNDTAHLRNYGMYLTYEVTKGLMLYLDYAYRVDKTNIDVPTALRDDFDKGTFSQLGIGLKYSFTGKDMVSSILQK